MLLHSQDIQKKDTPILSIIMPCYNVGKTLARAFDSVLMQKINYSFEVIFVDDASTDDTLSVAYRYKEVFQSFTIIHNETNNGNAISFYKGLCAAQGKYFCVLDGDDFYTIPGKLQKQLEFFEHDIREEYCIVGHYFILYFEDGKVFIDKNRGEFEYTYIDFLKNQYRYCHTTTMMYRNIYHGMPPDCFREEVFRGDSPRTFWELMLTNKKAKILDFVGSAYFFSYGGIWSSLSPEAQWSRTIRFLKALFEVVDSPYEKNILENRIQALCQSRQNKADGNPQREFERMDKDTLLKSLVAECQQYAFSIREFTFHRLYGSEYIDTLCSTIGYLQMLEMGISPFRERITTASEPHFTIVISGLAPRGGGIFAELTELIGALSPHPVTVLVAEMEEIPEEALTILSHFSNLSIKSVPKSTPDRFKRLFECFVSSNPTKAFFYVGHNNAFINALIQPGLSQHIHIFSYDHGFVLGLHNASYQAVIVKRPVDYPLLRTLHGDNVAFIPCQIGKKKLSNSLYIPFYEHKKLITASAARFYKLEQGYPIHLLDLILESLQDSGRKHIHYGPIPEDCKERIRTYLVVHQLPENCFVNIEWTENLPQSLLENHIDIFIASFPVVSYKITLEVLSSGVPVICYNGKKRLSTIDFIYEENLTYNNSAQFIDILQSLDIDTLIKHSQLSLKYVREYHDNGKIQKCLLSCKNYTIPRDVSVFDNSISDISQERQFHSGGIIRALAQQHEQAGDLDAAVRVIRQALTSSPSSLSLHGYLCHLLRKSGKAEESLTVARELANIYPNAIESQLQLMYATNACGKLEESLAVADRVLEREPGRQDIRDHKLRIQIRLLEQEERFDEAIELIQQSLSLSLSLSCSLCHLLRKCGKFEESLSVARQLERDYPEAMESLLQLMYALGACGRLEEACAVADRILEREPERRDIRDSRTRMKSKLLEQGGCFDEAINLIRKTISLNPNDLYYRSYLCHLLRCAQHPKEALFEAERLDAEHPESIEGKRQIMYALDACGRTKEALEYAKQLLVEIPEQKDATVYIATYNSLI